jgi:hypothetical protein
MDREWVIEQFTVLLPLAVGWASKQEHRILQHGVPLTRAEIEDAEAVGVVYPGKVRLLPVKVVPWPGAGVLRAACKAVNFLTTTTRGLTLGYGIFIREDCWRERALIAHELVHTAQYERLGGTAPFLRQYLTECLTVGYNDSPLEKEAVIAAADLLART